MSVSEIIGLAMAAGLLGAVCGAVAVTVIAERGRRFAEARDRRAHAYVRWLAARLALSRACVALVASLRALANEHPDSHYFDLRKDESRRARNQWYEAMHELDLTQATLVVTTGDPSVRRQLNRLGRIDADLIRRAVQENDPQWESLLEQLRFGDRQAVHFVETATTSERPVGPRAENWLTRAVQLGGSILRHWMRP